MTVIAAGTSLPKPESGQSHRSGPNFTLISDDGGPITLSLPSGIVFDIKQDISLKEDPTPVKDATNGTVVPGGKLTTGKNYYIANPRNATSNFSVTLNQA
ncbi:hypothetical protein [Acidovorax sp. Leaf78]|uniref:hypothetical protein n=1 Tax=unclassified Acidovorax TaxID=2684926 RepID=UPI000A65C9ED|nr:hypothetical protein [Acidovorax sp. Leaf78]